MILLLTLLCAAPAAAHLTPNSEVRLGFARDHVEADIIIPEGEYGLASGNPVGNGVAALKAATAYLRQHVHIRSGDGTEWRLTISHIEFAQIAGPPDLHAIARFDPPPGVATQRLVIDWTAVTGALPGHFVLFVAASDFAGGHIGGEPRILGAVQGARHLLAIDRGDPGLGRGLRAAIALGMHHIAEGRDHLLFLVTLLLPAPLLAAGDRWRARRTLRSAAWHLAGIITTFTIGHSATLIMAAAFGWRLPAAPVEIAIALTILVAALHAWRPLFPGREALVAGMFGLIHGLAFATAVAGFGLDATERGLAILGFNLGIEAVQLAVIALVLPLLLLVMRSPRAALWRGLGAASAGVAALAWLAERVAGTANPVAQLVDQILGSPMPWVVGIAAAIDGALALRRRSIVQ